MEFQVYHGQTDLLSHTQNTSAANNGAAVSLPPSDLLNRLLSRFAVQNHLSTEELANILRIKPASIRSGLCRKDNYLGLIPIRLPNRRLVWSTEDVKKLLIAGRL